MLRHIAYTVLGVAITAYTYYVTQVVTTKPAMYIFFLVGFALIVYGSFKLIQNIIFTGETDETPLQDEVIACPNCGVKHYTTSNYCHKCGTKL